MTRRSGCRRQPRLARRRMDGEQRWWVALTLLAAVILQASLPEPFVLRFRYVLPTINLIALVALVISHPERMSRRTVASGWPPRCRSA